MSISDLYFSTTSSLPPDLLEPPELPEPLEPAEPFEPFELLEPFAPVEVLALGEADSESPSVFTPGIRTKTLLPWRHTSALVAPVGLAEAFALAEALAVLAALALGIGLVAAVATGMDLKVNSQPIPSSPLMDLTLISLPLLVAIELRRELASCLHCEVLVICEDVLSTMRMTAS